MEFSKVKILLASASPRRRDLLQGLGWNFEVYPVDVDESPIPGELPKQTAYRLAGLKAQRGAGLFPDHLVIGADTVVDRAGEIYGKPRSDEEALAMLKNLSGNFHRVHSGLCVVWQGRMLQDCETTRVYFRRLSEEDCRSYVATGEHRGKAGAYAIQGRGAMIIHSIDGDYFNVVGLPLGLLGRIMERLGFPLTELWRAQ